MCRTILTLLQLHLRRVVADHGVRPDRAHLAEVYFLVLIAIMQILDAVFGYILKAACTSFDLNALDCWPLNLRLYFLIGGFALKRPRAHDFLVYVLQG